MHYKKKKVTVKLSNIDILICNMNIAETNTYEPYWTIAAVNLNAEILNIFILIIM